MPGMQLTPLSRLFKLANLALISSKNAHFNLSCQFKRAFSLAYNTCLTRSPASITLDYLMRTV